MYENSVYTIATASILHVTRPLLVTGFRLCFERFCPESVNLSFHLSRSERTFSSTVVRFYGSLACKACLLFSHLFLHLLPPPLASPISASALAFTASDLIPGSFFVPETYFFFTFWSLLCHRAVWYVRTNVLDEHTASVFSVEDTGIVFRIRSTHVHDVKQGHKIDVR